MSVTLQVKVNGGAPQTGAVTAAVADTIQLTAASMATWGASAAMWRIYDFPVGFAVPAGWSTSADGHYYYQGNSDPPAFTVTAGHQGKYIVDVTAYEAGSAVTDAATSLDVPFSGGFSNIGRAEGAIFGGTRLRWAATLKAALKYLYDSSVSVAAATPLATPSTIMSRDGSGNTAVAGLTAASVTGSTDLTLNCASGSVIKCQENGADVVRISDQGGVSHMSFRGAANARIESVGTTLTVASGSGALILQHNITDVCQLSVAANVANIAGQGSSGTTVSANAGPLRMQCASGSEVRIGEGATDVLYISDVGGLATIQGRGGSGSIFGSTPGYTLVQGSTFVGLQSDAAQIQFNSFNGVFDYYGNSVLRRKLTLGATTTDDIQSGVTYQLQSNATTRFSINGTGIGFYATAPVAKPTVSGAKGGNLALGSLMTALSNLGLVTDSTTA